MHKLTHQQRQLNGTLQTSIRCTLQQSKLDASMDAVNASMAACQLINMTYVVSAEAERSSVWLLPRTLQAGVLPATQLGRPCHCTLSLSTS
jgi:hypothetical protein